MTISCRKKKPSENEMQPKARLEEPYYFHATTANRLPSIAEFGLLPGLPSRWAGKLSRWSAGKVFFTADRWAVGMFIKDEMKRNAKRGEEIQVPALLRVPRTAIRDAREDMLWFNVFVERPVGPEDREVWVPWAKAWIPIVDAASEFKDLSFGRVKNLEKLMHQYFEKDWPEQESSWV